MRAVVVLRPAPVGWWTDRFRAVGTTVHVVAHGGPAGAGDAVRALSRDCERAWSRFRPESELVRLNADPCAEVPVSPLLHLGLQRALAAWAATDGWFDPTVLDALEAAGYDRTFEELDDRPRPVPTGTAVPGAERVTLLAAAVRRPPGVRLDLGGVGKGLLADLAARWLVSAGAGSACVSVGGDLRVTGLAPAGGWPVPVEDPYRVGTSFVADLSAGALATSSTSLRRWPTEDGGWAHHLIDPTTGAPSRSGVVSAVVAAAEAWWAESLAKAVLLAGERTGAALLERHAATGWLHLDDGRVLTVRSGVRVPQADPGRRAAPPGPPSGGREGRPSSPPGDLSSNQTRCGSVA